MENPFESKYAGSMVGMGLTTEDPIISISGPFDPSVVFSSASKSMTFGSESRFLMSREGRRGPAGALRASLRGDSGSAVKSMTSFSGPGETVTGRR